MYAAEQATVYSLVHWAQLLLRCKIQGCWLWRPFLLDRRHCTGHWYLTLTCTHANYSKVLTFRITWRSTQLPWDYQIACWTHTTSTSSTHIEMQAKHWKAHAHSTITTGTHTHSHSAVCWCCHQNWSLPLFSVWDLVSTHSMSSAVCLKPRLKSAEQFSPYLRLHLRQRLPWQAELGDSSATATFPNSSQRLENTDGTS